MQKISTWLWFNNEAEKVADYYTKIFKNGKITNVSYVDPEKKRILAVKFTLGEDEFGTLNNNNDYAKMTPANSLTVNCETVEEINDLWEELTYGGNVLTPLDEYSFAELYGWCTDKFGVSWQLFLNEEPQRVIPHLFFTDEKYKNAQKAIDFYLDTFDNANVELIEKGNDNELTWSYLSIDDFLITLDDLPGPHDYEFSDAMSYAIKCEDQEEIDKLWNRLTSNGGSEMPCFWAKDKFGVSWQLIPKDFANWVTGPNGDKVTSAMLKMTKPIIADLLKANQGKSS